MTSNDTSLSGLDVSRETIDRLHALCALIEKWTAKINLIAPKSVPEMWERHIVDSAQIYALAPPVWQNWVDLGSGGGLPALVIAILDPNQQPMTLIESDQRKCLFLQTARRELSLNVQVLNERIEKAELEKVDVLSARALAPLDGLLDHADRLLTDDGIAMFPKGARYQDELAIAQKNWHFDVNSHPSKTNPDSCVLEISKVRRREH